jgi:hypothetical protein
MKWILVPLGIAAIGLIVLALDDWKTRRRYRRTALERLR